MAPQTETLARRERSSLLVEEHQLIDVRSRRRIVVFRPGALGDALLAFPALAALRRAWPDAHVTLVARPDVLPLARIARLAHATYPYDLPPWSGLWGEAPSADPLLLRVVQDADAVVAWLPDPDGQIVRSLQRLGVRKYIVASGRPKELHKQARPRDHVAMYLLRTLAPLGIGEIPANREALAEWMSPLGILTPRPPSHAQEGEAAHTLDFSSQLREAESNDEEGASDPCGQLQVALHPGSGSVSKCWAPERYACLAKWLRAAGYIPVLVEGPADAGAVAALLASLGDSSVKVVREMTIEALVALLARCAAFVGNDSGVTHLAGLVGCPTLALFGPSDPMLWAPVGPHVRVMRAPTINVSGAEVALPYMDDLDEQVVWAGLRALLAGQTEPEPAG